MRELELIRLPGNFMALDMDANIWSRQYADEMSNNIRASHHHDISISLSNCDT